MFESTYLAVYNSFRAIVGVADQFHHLKTHLANIFSALAIWRYLKYILRKLLRLLRISSNGEEVEWFNELASSNRTSIGAMSTGSLTTTNKKKPKNWIFFLFFGVVIGGPYLVWRILSSSVDKLTKDDSLWMKQKVDHFIAVSEYEFNSNNEDELSFKRGQRIIIAPKGLAPF
jgi:peroxin-13